MRDEILARLEELREVGRDPKSYDIPLAIGFAIHDVTAILDADPVARRRVVQITATEGEFTDTIWTLCNDGAMFYGFWAKGEGFKWERLPDIPQEESRDE